LSTHTFNVDMILYPATRPAHSILYLRFYCSWQPPFII